MAADEHGGDRVNRVGQVWEFHGSDYIGVVVRSRAGAATWVHDLMWLVQDNKPGQGDLYPCVEGTFSVIGVQSIV